MNAQSSSSEKITAFDLNKPDLTFPMDRDQFYNEQIACFKKTGKSTKGISIVDVLLFDVSGEIFVQKRSNAKRHNPDLFDKSIGGHVASGDNPDFTVMVETVQELNVPSIVLRSEQDYLKCLRLLSEYLDTIALIKNVSVFVAPLKKIFDGESVIITNKKYLYLGMYNGSTKTIDRESKGVLLYKLDDLIDEMKKFPERFTADMHYYIEHHEKDLRKFIGDAVKVITKS
jgi:hypothetical protein